PPPASATSAVTGTASTPVTAALTTSTCTGAWSSAAAAVGLSSVTVAGTVGGPWRPKSFPVGCAATVDSVAIRPVTLPPSGSVTVTGSFWCTRCVWFTGMDSVTPTVVDEPDSMGSPPAGGPPTFAVTVVTRSGPGWNDTAPRSSRPVTSCPVARCHRRSAAAVAWLKVWSTVRLAAVAWPRATRFSSTARTSGPAVTPADRLRQAGRSAKNNRTGRLSTAYTGSPRLITCPGSGSHV